MNKPAPQELTPCKHAVMCQHWAGTGPMLPASAQNRPSSGMFTGTCYMHAILNIIQIEELPTPVSSIAVRTGTW